MFCFLPTIRDPKANERQRQIHLNCSRHWCDLCHLCPTQIKLKSIDGMYSQTSNISRTLVDNKTVDYSDVVGASPVGAAPTTSSLSTYHLTSMVGQRQLQNETRDISVLKFGAAYIRGFTVSFSQSRSINQKTNSTNCPCVLFGMRTCERVSSDIDKQWPH